MSSGWVTIVKDGHELVRKRDRLGAGRRLLHMEQWQRRLRTDKTIAANATSKVDAKFAARSTSRCFEHELASDPDGIAFAFGGVDPGTLHAHGQLHDVHRAHYSVGRAGHYLLHVQLRQQALPFPGSPFTLHVVPGAANSLSTRVDLGESTVKGLLAYTVSIVITLLTPSLTLLSSSRRSGRHCRRRGLQVDDKSC